MPISSIIANLFMEELETKAISSASSPSGLWRWYVDTLVIQRTEYGTQFLNISTLSPSHAVNYRGS